MKTIILIDSYAAPQKQSVFSMRPLSLSRSDPIDRCTVGRYTTNYRSQPMFCWEMREEFPFWVLSKSKPILLIKSKSSAFNYHLFDVPGRFVRLLVFVRLSCNIFELAEHGRDAWLVVKMPFDLLRRTDIDCSCYWFEPLETIRNFFLAIVSNFNIVKFALLHIKQGRNYGAHSRYCSSPYIITFPVPAPVTAPA